MGFRKSQVDDIAKPKPTPAQTAMLLVALVAVEANKVKTHNDTRTNSSK